MEKKLDSLRCNENMLKSDLDKTKSELESVNKQLVDITLIENKKAQNQIKILCNLLYLTDSGFIFFIPKPKSIFACVSLYSFWNA
jgi:hypothetical protein